MPPKKRRPAKPVRSAAYSKATARKDSLDSAWAESVGHLNAGRFAEAEQSVAQLLKQRPNQADAVHLWGIAAYRQGRSDEAIDRLKIAVEMDHLYARAWRDLGIMLYENQRLQEAEEALYHYISLEKMDASAQGMLGSTLRDLGRSDEAIRWFESAIALQPEDVHLYKSLAKTYLGLQQLDDAIETYQTALRYAPRDPELYRQMVAALRRAGRMPEAAEAASQWLQVDPQNAIAQHMVAALGAQPAPDRASKEYVRELFDEFAERFDRDLTALDYQGPRLIGELLSTWHARQLEQLDPNEPRANDRVVLDAGCGTGLCAAHLRPLSRELVGVDLSPGMLAVASQLKIYDELIAGELTEYLVSQTARFDWIVSADTLIYFGDLRPVIDAAWNALKTPGELVFTIEHDVAESDVDIGYRLQPNGRFVHRESKVLELLAAAGFQLECSSPQVLRYEAGKPVPSVLIHARKTDFTQKNT